jgi:Fe-S-cluster containining protein
MGNGDDNSPLALFKALREAFSETIRSRRGSPDLVKELSVQAFDSFDGNVAIQIEDMPALACHQGCAACCDLRVAATAPEILLIAQYIVATRPAFAGIGVDLGDRIARDAAITSGLDDDQRLALRRPCPFIEDSLCLVYRVRPLACRGHASFDKAACAEAMVDMDREALVSMPHFWFAASCRTRCWLRCAILASLGGSMSSIARLTSLS